MQIFAALLAFGLFIYLVYVLINTEEMISYRIAKQHGISAEVVQKVINEHTRGPQFGLFSAPVVNVLAVNMALEKLNP